MVDRSSITSSAGEVRPDSDELRQAVQALLEDFSIETTPHAPEEVERLPEFLPPGTRVYVARPPNSTLDEVVRLSIRVKELGMRPFPHLVARLLADREELARAAGRLGDAGIRQALVIAGDRPQPRGPFESSLQVLETGLLQEHGILSIAIAGHPEGSRVIGTSMLRHSMSDKVRLAEETGLRMHIVSQFGFDPQAVFDWEATMWAEGIHLPVHVGMAGKAPLKQVLRYAIRCGVASSMRMLISRADSFTAGGRLTPVDELIVAFARHRIGHRNCRLHRTHFFAFGGAERTGRWLEAIRSGGFDFDESGRRLRVG